MQTVNIPTLCAHLDIILHNVHCVLLTAVQYTHIYVAKPIGYWSQIICHKSVLYGHWATGYCSL